MGTIYGAYGYANSAWGDQLTSYNMQTISYDSMGNPISYLGATLSWNGKQLTGYSKGGTNVTYAYNEDGLRTQKTYNGTTANYYYNGSVLIGMQSGNTVQRFSYDAQGKVVAVDYSENGGSSYTTYYYLRNAQGDIVKLIDNNKNTVVEYTYDSWGKLISTTGSLATSLGANQPVRYRGYVYDTETQWYYLQTRYYDPNTCRFISSDVYLSTGQGVIGHNSYAYCLNTPVNGHDSDGHRFRPDDYNQECTDSGRGNRYKPWCFTLLHNDLAKKVVEKGAALTKEEWVLFSINKGEASFYKGCIIIPVGTDGAGGGLSWYPVILIGKGEKRAWVVKHEFGHVIQKGLLGTPRYLRKIAIPSLINSLTNGKNQSDAEYHSLLCERSADLWAGLTYADTGFEWKEGSDILSMIYLLLP